MAAFKQGVVAGACALFLAGCGYSLDLIMPAKSSPPPPQQPPQEQAAAQDDAEFQAFKIKGPKKRVGVLDFEDASGRGARNAAVVVRDVITEGLVKSGAFVVVEREQLANVLKEQGLGMTGALSPASVAKASKLLGLQALITGKITDYDEDVKSGGYGGYYNQTTRIAFARVSVRMVDATTGEIWLAESGEGRSDARSKSAMGGTSTTSGNTAGRRALYVAIKTLMDKIVAKADSKPWAGSVVKVSKDQVYITAGSDTNLPVGATLQVRRLGAEITDPATGTVIGREVGKVLGVLQVSQHLNEKLTLCVSTRGGGFQVGDEVTLDETALQ